MKKVIFTPRHAKLIKLNDDIGLLLLGQKNQEYIKELKAMKKQTIEEIKKEQARAMINSL